MGSWECDGHGGGGEATREEVRKLNGMYGVGFESHDVYLVGKGWGMVRDPVER